ncbi:odorant receptor 82a-like [Halyomorpha halys]|uniref:odorant receptor 82a-like n=1 Tax=Halyomorpha halys TaxID=286706 RepID=UPI0006D521CE|nr:Odorant receptor 41 [Halyomorpha halys]
MGCLGPIADSDIIDGLSIRFLKFFGLWKVINDYRTTGKKNSIIRFTVIISFILAVPYVLFQYLSYSSIKVDLQKATFLNLYPLPALQMICRILVFWFRMDRQCRLYNLLKKDFLHIPENKRVLVDKVYQKICKTSNICCTASMIVNFSIIGLYIFNPGISVDYILYHTGNMDAVTTGRKKILGGWYPLPMAQTPYYEIIFVYEATCVSWAGILLAVYFCLFFQVLISLYAQFTVLGVHISTLKFQSNKKDRKCDTKMFKELSQILRDHQKLLRYTDELKSVYNPLVTLTLGMGILILIIGAIQFLLGKSNSPGFIFKLLQVFIFQGVEVSMFCFGSSFIEMASSDLHFTIYSSDWYMAGTKFRKAAQMMMIRAKKGETLTAIGMYPVNRETLMTILQFTYTTSTVLSRITE